jgi:biotin transporter BioY
MGDTKYIVTLAVAVAFLASVTFSVNVFVTLSVPVKVAVSSVGCTLQSVKMILVAFLLNDQLTLYWITLCQLHTQKLKGSP